MTLIAGFRCTDGFVIAADTEITVGSVRVQGHKLMTSGLSGPTFCIAFAGDVAYGLAASQQIRDAIRGLASQSLANMKQSIRDTLADFYARHMRHDWYSGAERPWLSLTIGLQDFDTGEFSVMSTCDDVVYDVENAVFIGSGHEVAKHVSERLFDNRNHSTAVTHHLVQQLFREIKRTGPYVGGNTEIVSRRAGPSADPFFKLPSFENEKRAFWGLEDDLWIAIRNALTTEHVALTNLPRESRVDGYLKEMRRKIKRLSADCHDKRNILPSSILQMQTTEFGTEIGNEYKDLVMPPKRRRKR